MMVYASASMVNPYTFSMILLTSSKTICSPFSCDCLKDFPLEDNSGEIAWVLMHKVHEKDQQSQANLRAAPKVNATVLHPSNCKHNVPATLAVFDPSTITAIQGYCSENRDSAGFLYIVYVWWTISNSKVQFNSHNKLGNAVYEGDGYPDFLRCFAVGSKTGKIKKIPIAKNFTFSTQRKALISSNVAMPRRSH